MNVAKNQETLNFENEETLDVDIILSIIACGIFLFTIIILYISTRIKTSEIPKSSVSQIKSQQLQSTPNAAGPNLQQSQSNIAGPNSQQSGHEKKSANDETVKAVFDFVTNDSSENLNKALNALNEVVQDESVELNTLTLQSSSEDLLTEYGSIVIKESDSIVLKISRLLLRMRILNLIYNKWISVKTKYREKLKSDGDEESTENNRVNEIKENVKELQLLNNSFQNVYDKYTAKIKTSKENVESFNNIIREINKDNTTKKNLKEQISTEIKKITKEY